MGKRTKVQSLLTLLSVVVVMNAKNFLVKKEQATSTDPKWQKIIDSDCVYMSMTSYHLQQPSKLSTNN